MEGTNTGRAACKCVLPRMHANSCCQRTNECSWRYIPCRAVCSIWNLEYPWNPEPGPCHATPTLQVHDHDAHLRRTCKQHTSTGCGTEHNTHQKACQAGNMPHHSSWLATRKACQSQAAAPNSCASNTPAVQLPASAIGSLTATIRASSGCALVSMMHAQSNKSRMRAEPCTHMHKASTLY